LNYISAADSIGVSSLSRNPYWDLPNSVKLRRG